MDVINLANLATIVLIMNSSNYVIPTKGQIYFVCDNHGAFYYATMADLVNCIALRSSTNRHMHTSDWSRRTNLLRTIFEAWPAHAEFVQSGKRVVQFLVPAISIQKTWLSC